MSQIPEIIHSTQSCISDLKAWMTNIQLQCVYTDITEMFKPAAKMFLNCGSVPQTISLESSDVRFASAVSLDPAISFQQQISSVCSICYLKLHRISAVRYYLPKMSPKQLLRAFVLSRLDYCNSLLMDCPKYFLFKVQKL